MQKHTKPGYSKANKSLTVSKYKELLELAADARNLVGAKYDRLSVGKYIRVFTEPRKGGLRTKFYGSGTVKPNDVKRIQNTLTKKFPQLDVNVVFDNNTHPYKLVNPWTVSSLSIYMRVKPKSTTKRK